MRLVALTRAVPESLPRCELTHVARAPIDVHLAQVQHEAYEQALAALGCDVRRIPGAPHLPDSLFVEDTAVVLDDVAIVARPGAASRRAETPAVAAALAAFRSITYIVEPATLDGGDVLRLGRTLYVGAGGRTSAEGIRQLADAARIFGYSVLPVPVHGCLHLKSAIAQAAPDVLLLNPDWVDAGAFAGSGCRLVTVDPAEPHAANVLMLDETVLCAAACEGTAARLAAEGMAVQTVDVSELAKAEAGLTCCSLLVASL